MLSLVVRKEGLNTLINLAVVINHQEEMDIAGVKVREASDMIYLYLGYYLASAVRINCVNCNAY